MSALGGPRVGPLPRERWDADARAALRAGLPDGRAEPYLEPGPDATRLPNAVGSLLHHPKLAGPFLAFNRVLLDHSVVDARLRELMILRIAWQTRSEYEWVQHVRMAPRVAITTEEIGAVMVGADAVTWTPLEAALLAATDQLLDSYTIDDATWSTLAGHLDAAQLLEVPFIVGTYVCLGMVLGSIGVELDPELDISTIPPLPLSPPSTA